MTHGHNHFRMYELIVKKRDGKTLSPDDIHWVVSQFTAGAITDAQMAAFLMAVYWRGMNDRETTAFTEAMIDSGDRLDLSAAPGVKVDKHSTGGVGDKTTLVLIPLVAACGLPVAKMSGRGLGHTGGTLDKLESIPGVRTDLSIEQFMDQLERVGAVVCGQTGQLTPADKKVYALRNETATVESIPLVASSVMAKKIAAGADAFVLDVKMGKAAFAKTEEEAIDLARAMVGIAEGFGRRAVAWISAMDQPLGQAVGNAIEVYEAVDALEGQGPADLRELCLVLGAEMLCLGGVADTPEQARSRLEHAIASGAAKEKFNEIVAAQGGRLKEFEAMRAQGVPPNYRRAQVMAPTGGHIAEVDGFEIGLAAMALGAGRQAADAAIDPHVGIRLLKKEGDAVASGEPIAEVIAKDDTAAVSVQARMLRAVHIVSQPITHKRPLLGRRFEV